MRPTPSKSPIPQNLRRLRLAAGLTQAQLAELADATDATISRIEWGRFAPSQDLLQRLAVAVGGTEAELVARAAAPKKLTLRPAETRLLAAVRGWDEAAIDDLVKGVRLIAAAAVRNGDPPRKSSGLRRRANH
ncbi:MAG TPA: helix-turn-helix transcriptional regulator [Polyangiaceae bacterium]